MTTLPGNQVRRGSEQPDRGLWMPRDSGAEEIDEFADVKTTVHRWRAHYLLSCILPP